MRITLEVQNGIVQIRNSAVCIADRAHVKGEEIGDREAEDERDGPDDEAERERREVGLERDAQVGQLREAALEDVGVVLQREGRDELVLVVAPRS